MLGYATLQLPSPTRGHHTIYRKNTFIAILVPNLSFVIFIICRIYRFVGCIYSCTCPIYRPHCSQQVNPLVPVILSSRKNEQKKKFQMDALQLFKLKLQFSKLVHNFLYKNCFICLTPNKNIEI